MKKIWIKTVKLTVSSEIYEAAKQFMEEKGLDIEAELSTDVQKFYRKYVPADVRKYIEHSTERCASPTTPKTIESVIGPVRNSDFE